MAMEVYEPTLIVADSSTVVVALPEEQEALPHRATLRAVAPLVPRYEITGNPSAPMAMEVYPLTPALSKTPLALPEEQEALPQWVNLRDALGESQCEIMGNPSVPMAMEEYWPPPISKVVVALPEEQEALPQWATMSLLGGKAE